MVPSWCLMVVNFPLSPHRIRREYFHFHFEREAGQNGQVLMGQNFQGPNFVQKGAANAGVSYWSMDFITTKDEFHEKLRASLCIQ